MLTQAGQANPGPQQNQLILGAALLTNDAKSRMTDWVLANPGPIQDSAQTALLTQIATKSGHIADTANGLKVGINPGPQQDELNQIISNANAISSLANGKLQCTPATGAC